MELANAYRSNLKQRILFLIKTGISNMLNSNYWCFWLLCLLHTISGVHINCCRITGVLVTVSIIHLLTGCEGNSTFIVPKVPTIVRGNAEDNSRTEGTIKVLLPEIQVYKCFIILNNCAIQNSKL